MSDTGKSVLLDLLEIMIGELILRGQDISELSRV